MATSGDLDLIPSDPHLADKDDKDPNDPGLAEKEGEAPVLIGRAALRSELEALSIEDLERRCRVNGLVSKASGFLAVRSTLSDTLVVFYDHRVIPRV